MSVPDVDVAALECWECGMVLALDVDVDGNIATENLEAHLRGHFKTRRCLYCWQSHETGSCSLGPDGLARIPG